MGGSPTRLPHSRDLALQGQLTQHNPADTELAIYPTTPTRNLATVALTGRELGLPLHLSKYSFAGHI